MKQDIKYTGLSANPSDHEAPDGDLTTALNLLHEDGDIKPVFQPTDLAELPSNCKIVFIHKTVTYSHYIILDGNNNNTLKWIDASVINDAHTHPVTSETISTELSAEGHSIHSFIMRVLLPHQGAAPGSPRYRWISTPIYKVHAIGNTLIVLAGDGPHYILWKGDEAEYRYLGQKPKMLSMEFDLYNESFHWSESDTLDQNVGIGPSSNTYNYNGIDVASASDRQTLANAAWALINRVNAKIAERGAFYAPFYVRYCYRMYDGSCFMHSAPVLMARYLEHPFHVRISNVSIRENSYNNPQYEPVTPNNENYKLHYDAVYSFLHYKCHNYTEAMADLQLWSDIIKSVDIFITPPILRDDDTKGIRNADVAFQLEFPGLTEYQYYKKIRDVGTLKKLYSFSLESSDVIILDSEYEYQLSASGRIPVDPNIIKTIDAQEDMKDYEKTHNVFFPLTGTDGKCATSMVTYNSRLHMTELQERLFEGFSMEEMMQGSLMGYGSEDGIICVDSIAVKLKTEDGIKTVVHIQEYEAGEETYYVSDLFKSRPLFYPDSRAFKMIINFHYSDAILEQVPEPYRSQYTGARHFELDMFECPILKNGSITGPTDLLYADYYYNNIPAFYGETAGEVEFTEDNIVNNSGKLYSTEANNPFYFPDSGVNTLGSGAILGICSAAKALSQGQFGQFPLYAFTTDGVWALEVASNGIFSARQPITRDVCINPDSITQLDSAVLFATNRGIMLIQGSEAICITDGIATEYPFNVLSRLPHAADLHTMLGHGSDTCLPTKPFLQFLSGCQMIYDYIHQRILLFNPNLNNNLPQYTYAYIYSLKSKNWGMMFSDLSYPLNSYPDALAITQDNHLVSFSDTDQDICKGLLITRPLKLGDGDTLKSIHTLLQRGNFQRGDVNTVLYGSRDLVNWHIIASSVNHEIRNLRGTPYKYFRIASVATLSPDKSIYGVTIDVEPRHTSVLH